MALELNRETLSMIWAKASIIPNYDMNVYRSDAYGTAIAWHDYGRRDSQYGWEVDHIVPVSKGGSDALSNLRPLHWKNNAAKSDN